MTSTPLTTSDISIIIPTLNEEKNIGRLPDNLGASVGEVIIVDGGSSDGTIAAAIDKGFQTETCAPGRAAQLNHGANISKGRILLFLHADTRLPEDFSELPVSVLKRRDVIAGAFSLAIRNPTPALSFIAWCTNLRSRYLQLPYGDQAIFITREKFEQLGQFPQLPIMEDYVFMKKARQSGKIHTLQELVITSARRWQRLGVIRTTLTNQLVIWGYHLKIPLKYLVSLYRL